MGAHELARQNFAVAEHLLQLYELFRGLKEEGCPDQLRLVVCRVLGLEESAAVRMARSDNALLGAGPSAPIPAPLLYENGADFLLRQAVLVSCSAVESFFWDSLRENVLTVVRARRRAADDSIRKLTLTLDDYLSIETYTDPNERLRQIILKNFERGTLSDSGAIERIASILTLPNCWSAIAARCGQEPREITRSLNELIQRRNQIAHRADRPDPEAQSPEEQDGYGFRAIHYSWVHMRYSTAKSVVDAAHQCFQEALQRLEQQLARMQEQELARKTLE